MALKSISANLIQCLELSGYHYTVKGDYIIIEEYKSVYGMRFKATIVINDSTSEVVINTPYLLPLRDSLPLLDAKDIPRILENFSRLACLWAERNGDGVYYTGTLEGGSLVEGSFISNKNFRDDCLSIRILLARIGKLRSYLDDDLKCLLD